MFDSIKKIMNYKELVKALEEIQLSKDEVEFMILSVYKVSQDLENLHSEEIVKIFKELVKMNVMQTNELEEVKDDTLIKKESFSVNENIKDDDINNYSDDYEDENKNMKKITFPISHSVPQEYSNDPLIPVAEEITEDELIKISQNMFEEITQKFSDQNVNPEKLFENDIINQEEVKLLPIKTFFEKLESLGITEFSPRSKQCMQRILSEIGRAHV